MPESALIVRVDEELKAAFNAAAKAADCTASQLLRDFMQDYVDRQTEQLAYDARLANKVEEGRTALRDGRVKTNDEVEAYFAQRRARSLGKVAQSDL